MTRITLGFLALAVAFALAGCGKSDTVSVQTPDGKATVSTDASGKTEGHYEGESGSLHTETDASGNTSAEFTDKEGNKSTMNMGTSVDPADIGIELYPGSTRTESQTSDTKVETGPVIAYTVMRSTPDDPGKVVDFYKKLIKSPNSFSSGDTATIGGKTVAGDDVLVNATKDKDKNFTVVIVTAQKKKK